MMKKTLRMAILFLLEMSVLVGTASAELTATEILKKVDAILDSSATVLEATMTTVNSRKTQKSSDMLIYVKEDASGEARTLIQYLSPASDKGTKFLSLGSVDKMWMYLPQVEKMVRIAGSMVKQSMMSSDFSYEDLMDRAELEDDYTPQIIGDETIDGETCYVMMLKAKRGNANYRQMKLYVQKNNFIPVKQEFFSGSGKLIKTSTQTHPAVFDGRTIPTKIAFKDLKSKKEQQTILTIKNAKFNADIPEKYFTMQYLEKGQ